MGFSIGSFIGSIAPFVGGLLGGPVGAVIGSGVSAALAPSQPATVVGRQVAPSPQFAQQMTSIVPVPINIPSFVGPPRNGFGTGDFNVQRRRVGTLAPLAGGVARMIGPALGFGAGAVVSEILQQSREAVGRGVTKNKIIKAAKVCGIEAAADTFGLSEAQVCRVIVAGGTRRRRGISAADIRRTKRTLRFVRTIKKDLKAVRL